MTRSIDAPTDRLAYSISVDEKGETVYGFGTSLSSHTVGESVQMTDFTPADFAADENRAHLAQEALADTTESSIDARRRQQMEPDAWAMNRWGKVADKLYDKEQLVEARSLYTNLSVKYGPDIEEQAEASTAQFIKADQAFKKEFLDSYLATREEDVKKPSARMKRIFLKDMLDLNKEDFSNVVGALYRTRDNETATQENATPETEAVELVAPKEETQAADYDSEMRKLSAQVRQQGEMIQKLLEKLHAKDAKPATVAANFDLDDIEPEPTDDDAERNAILADLEAMDDIEPEAETITSEARKRLIGASAVRQARLWTGKGGKAEYNEADAAYQEELIAEGDAKLEKVTAPENELSLALKRQIINHVIESEEGLEAEAAEAMGKTKWGRFVNWMHNPNDSKLKRIAKNVGVGIAGTLIVTTATIASGGTLLATAGASAGAMVGMRAGISGAKIAARKESRQGRGMKTLETEEQKTNYAFDLHRVIEQYEREHLEGKGRIFDLTASKEALRHVIIHNSERREANIREEQGKRKRAAAGAAAGAVVGAVAGRLVAEGAESAYDALTNPGDAANTAGDSTGLPEMHILERPEGADIIAPAPAEVFSPDMSTITPGQSYTELLGKFNPNIPGDVKASIIEDLSKKLPSWTMDLSAEQGYYGLSHTGVMDQATMSTIAESIRAHGYDVAR